MITIYGKNSIAEALKAHSPISALYVLDEEIKKDNSLKFLIDKTGYKYELLSKKEMDKIVKANHQGYIAKREDYTIYEASDIDKFVKEKGRIVILDGIQDPHNLGAILRSVDAFGYDLVVLPKNRSTSVNETVAHTSTGAIEHVNIMYVNSLNNFIENLKKKGYWICGTDAKGTVLAEDIDNSLSLAVIIGSEGFGMSKTLVKESDYLISIPMVGHVNSLNASVSAGIVLKDLMRK